MTARVHLVGTAYPAVRRVMGSMRRELDDDNIEELLESMFPTTAPEDVENFMRTLQSIGKTVAPIAQRALPGMIQGAVQGGMMGGPWGALAGAVGGGAMSALGAGGGAGTPAPSAGGPRRPTPGNGPRALTGTTSALAPVGGDAVAQLLALLSRPETMQALLALLMSRSGRGSVSVGARRVPARAFANALAELAAQVADGDSPDDGAVGYLLDSEGEPRCDAADPGARALLLVSDLMRHAATEVPAEDWYEDDDPFDGWSDDVDDPLDGYEAGLQGRYLS